MQNILLVEDDEEITRLLTLHFDITQFSLTCCGTAKQAIQKMQHEKFHLVMMDITLPDGNGLELCKSLRTHDDQTPVMMVTCHGTEADKVLALELGADDYMTKPFGILELIARSKAIMRRSAKSRISVGNQLFFRDISIDPVMRKASLQGNRLDLTVKEFDLLYLLCSNPGKTFSRKELLEQVWGFAFVGYEHTVTSHINRLRIKLEANLNSPEYILTSWGSGYRFAE